jgi:hypothetical protein
MDPEAQKQIVDQIAVQIPAATTTRANDQDARATRQAATASRQEKSRIIK